MKKALFAALLALTFLLTSCSPGLETEEKSYPTLPPAKSKYSAPTGDAGMMHVAPVTLYLPSKNGVRLLAVTKECVLNHMEPKAQKICEELFAYPGDENVRPLGGSVNISLYGENPVETSSGVCTVNLSPSAAQLGSSDLFRVCLSIGSTLCELPEVHYVNVLIANQALSMDITGTLPQGSITSHPGEDIGVLWEQMDARKVPLGSNPALVPLSGAATIYFPINSGTGIMPETRNISFTGQSPAQLVLGLIGELSSGANYLTKVDEMPDIMSLMTLNPEITSLDDGTKSVALYFPRNVEDLLRDEGKDPASFIGAVSMTILSYVPAVSYVRFVEGSAPAVNVTGEDGSEYYFADGKITRSSVASMLREQVEFCLPGEKMLIPCSRFVPNDSSKDLRMIIRRIMEKPSQDEKTAGVTDALGMYFSNSDLIGISVIDDTLLVNLSLRAADGLSLLTKDEERMYCFSLVNTLCRISGFNKVSFFFEGEEREYLAGGVCWKGEFHQAPGLVKQSAG